MIYNWQNRIILFIIFIPQTKVGYLSLWIKGYINKIYIIFWLAVILTQKNVVKHIIDKNSTNQLNILLVPSIEYLLNRIFLIW